MALSLRLSSFILYPPKKWRVLSCRSSICEHSESPRSFERRSANYKPTIWHDNYIQSLSSGDKLESKKEKIFKLTIEVSQILCKQEMLKEKVKFVDLLQQLGIAYRFTNEIDCVINEIYESMNQILLPDMHDDLYLVSLLFRMLRTHGFSVHEDIFKYYLDKEGNWEEKLFSSDIKGTLSLYEAAYFAKEGEETLEMARHLTTKHLSDFLMSPNCDDSRLRDHVAHALDLPLNWRMERLHTRWFIDQYKTNKKMIPALWELAVLDFNSMQDLYKNELKHVSRWWTDLRLFEKLPFIRNRLAENYLWTVGGAFEPEHSTHRIAQTQANCLITTIDDIYDVYGSLIELEAFTVAIDKWDITIAETLPEYMQTCISALFNTVEDQGHEVFKRKGLNVIPYFKRAWKDLCKAYLKEARWYHSGYVPTLEEYLENAWVSISGNIAVSTAYCINNYVTAKELEQFSYGYPDIVRYSSMNLRLYNDLATSNAELERGDVNKVVQCYMRDKDVTELVARKEIKKIILKHWKLINGETVSNCAFGKYLKNVASNIARMAQCIYQHGDGYGMPDGETKDQISTLLFDSIELI